jgi:hypothetical protein
MSAQYNPQWLVNRFPNDLKAQVRFLVQQGYTVTHQDEKSAQLMRKKQFSCLIAFLTLFIFGVGFLLYLIWFLAKRDETIYLEIDQQKPMAVSPGVAKLGALNANFSSFETGNKGAIALLIVVAVLALYVFWKFTSGS